MGSQHRDFQHRDSQHREGHWPGPAEPPAKPLGQSPTVQAEHIPAPGPQPVPALKPSPSVHAPAPSAPAPAQLVSVVHFFTLLHKLASVGMDGVLGKRWVESHSCK